jgi:LPPG:FO 2-phospho-L-lactate transferase
MAPEGASDSPHEVTALVNTGDDVWMHGLRICPDLDTCMYTLGGGIDKERGWGHSGETWVVKEELAAYGAEPSWFGLGDKDIATHLIRSRMLRAGYPLSAVTEALCDRWQPGVRLLPMSDDRVETHVVIDDPEQDGQQKAVHFQEWWVRYRAEPKAHSIVAVGNDEAKPAPGVLEALKDADAVLFAPSNPVVSVGTVLGVPGVRDALRKTSAGVVGVSPIIGGKALRGMADVRGGGGPALRLAQGRRRARRLADRGRRDGRRAGRDRPRRTPADVRCGRDRGDGPRRPGTGWSPR